MSMKNHDDDTTLKLLSLTGQELRTHLLEARRIEIPCHGQVRAEDARLNGLDVTTNIRLLVDQVTVVELLAAALLLVGADNAVVVRVHLAIRLVSHKHIAEQINGYSSSVRALGRITYHKELLAQRAGALSQHIVRTHRDDRAQRKDERMHVLHVQIVRGNGIGHRVGRKHLRLRGGKLDHVFGVELKRVIAKLGTRHSLHTNKATQHSAGRK